MGDIVEIIDSNVDYMQYVEDDSTTVNKDIHSFKEEYLLWKRDKHLHNGEVMPWEKTADKVHFGKGQLTVWSGYNGHMKTQATLMVAMWLIKQDVKVHIASMEMQPVRMIERLGRLCSGLSNPSDAYESHMLDFFKGKLSLFDRQDQMTFDEIRGMVIHAATVKKCSHIFIDSLMMCGVGNKDYEGQSIFVENLVKLTQKYNIHIHLITHAKKPHDSNEAKIPDRYDISGSADISNKVDRIITVWMDKEKKMYEECGYPPSMSEEKISLIKKKPDVKLAVQKQRHEEFEGRMNFWVHNGSGQIIPTNSSKPMLYNINFKGDF